MRTIDADKLKNRIMESFGKHKETAKGLCEIVDAQPTVEPNKMLMWERDMVMEQLKSNGLRFGHKDDYGVRQRIDDTETMHIKLNDTEFDDLATRQPHRFIFENGNRCYTVYDVPDENAGKCIPSNERFPKGRKTDGKIR